MSLSTDLVKKDQIICAWYTFFFILADFNSLLLLQSINVIGLSLDMACTSMSITKGKKRFIKIDFFFGESTLKSGEMTAI